MKVKINAGSVNQVINAEKVKIDQSGNIHQSKQLIEEELSAPNDNKQRDGDEVNISSVKETLRQKIGEGKIEDAIDCLKKSQPSESIENQLFLIAGKYTLLKKDRANSILDSNEYEIRLSRILSSLLNLIDEL